MNNAVLCPLDAIAILQHLGFRSLWQPLLHWAFKLKCKVRYKLFRTVITNWKYQYRRALTHYLDLNREKICMTFQAVRITALSINMQVCWNWSRLIVCSLSSSLCFRMTLLLMLQKNGPYIGDLIFLGYDMLWHNRILIFSRNILASSHWIVKSWTVFIYTTLNTPDLRDSTWILRALWKPFYHVCPWVWFLLTAVTAPIRIEFLNGLQENYICKLPVNNLHCKAYQCLLTLILLTWRIGWAPNNASRWQMGFNLAFKGLISMKMCKAICSIQHMEI